MLVNAINDKPDLIGLNLLLGLVFSAEKVYQLRSQTEARDRALLHKRELRSEYITEVTAQFKLLADVLKLPTDDLGLYFT